MFYIHTNLGIITSQGPGDGRELCRLTAHCLEQAFLCFLVQYSPLLKNSKFSFSGLFSETRDFPTVISLIHTFFYYLLFLWLLFLSLIENWPRFSILSSEESFDSLAPQLSLGWQDPLLFWVGRKKSSAQLCRRGSLLLFTEALHDWVCCCLHSKALVCFWALGCPLGWRLPHAVRDGAHLPFSSC